MERAEKQLIKAFWLANVCELSNGEMQSGLMERAYCCGSVVADYHKRVENLDGRDIIEGLPEFVSSLTEDQLLGCIGYHFRADHFDNHHFCERENVLSLQRCVQAWLEKVSKLPVPPVDSIVYTNTACGLAGPDNPDLQWRAEFRLGGEVKISERYIARSTKRAVEGTEKDWEAFLDMETAIALFAALYSLPDVTPGQTISLPACDALIDVTFKSKDAKITKETVREWDEETDSFVEALYKALDKVNPDLEEEED